jgi:hypothetical protein
MLDIGKVSVSDRWNWLTLSSRSRQQKSASLGLAPVDRQMVEIDRSQPMSNWLAQHCQVGPGVKMGCTWIRSGLVDKFWTLIEL